ncbi:hypothetical protein NN561_014459 [Cricetulus griseus]
MRKGRAPLLPARWGRLAWRPRLCGPGSREAQLQAPRCPFSPSPHRAPWAGSVSQEAPVQRGGSCGDRSSSSLSMVDFNRTRHSSPDLGKGWVNYFAHSGGLASCPQRGTCWSARCWQHFLEAWGLQHTALGDAAMVDG